MKRVSRSILFIIFGWCFFALLISCGAKHNGKASGREEQTVELEGVLSSRGNMPFPALLLEADGGHRYVVRSATLFDELRRLAGMDVSVECVLAPEKHFDLPVIIVNRYVLLPLSTGEVPVVGRLSVEGDRCMLVDEEGTEIEIVGEFTGVLKEFAGAKIWVVGTGSMERGSGNVIEASGYGIINPAE